MAQVSKRLLKNEVYNEIFQTLLTTVAKLNTKSRVSDFFDDFLSPTEKVMFSKRLAIGILIAEKRNYSEIKEILKVSGATVARLALLYRYGRGYRDVVDNIRKNKEVREFLIELGIEISSIGAWGGKGSTTWRAAGKSLKEKKSNLVQ